MLPPVLLACRCVLETAEGLHGEAIAADVIEGLAVGPAELVDLHAVSPRDEPLEPIEVCGVNPTLVGVTRSLGVSSPAAAPASICC